MARLENWSVGTKDPYTPPEYARVSGTVYGHPRFQDGEFITLSTVIEVNGIVIRTKNTTYLLGEPDAEYVRWCLDNGYDRPITITLKKSKYE